MRYFVFMFLILMLPAVKAQDDKQDFAWTCPSGYRGQELSIYNWTTYIAENTIPDFEDACNVTVNYQTYDNDTLMFEQIRLGNPGYDLVMPSNQITGEMLQENLAIPLNHDLIPNMENIIPELLAPPYDLENQYTIPYQWGVVAIGYRTEAFPDGIDSWDDVWNYDGPVAWIDDARIMLGIALWLLGYDPNTTDTSQILEARDFLGEHADNVVDILPDSEGQLRLADGSVDIVIEYSGDIVGIMNACACDDYAFVIPQEGAHTWFSNWLIPVDAANPELAMVFLDYVLDPQVSADISNFTAFGSSNQLAIDEELILPDLLNNEAIYPSQEILEKLFILVDVDDDTLIAYQVAWDELRTFYQD